MHTAKHWRLLWQAFTSCCALALCACTGLALQPAAAPIALAGSWQQDRASSDNFDRKLGPLLENERRRMQPHHGSAGAAGTRRGGERGGAGTDELDTLVMPPEEPDKLRTRLSEDLRPPASLHIALAGDAVEITADAEPVRHYLPGQSVSRIDTSGAATVSCGWDQRAFVIRASYTNRAARSWRYELEPAGLLRVTFEAKDAEFGSLTLLTRYRRTP